MKKISLDDGFQYDLIMILDIGLVAYFLGHIVNTKKYFSRTRSQDKNLKLVFKEYLYKGHGPTSLVCADRHN